MYKMSGFQKIPGRGWEFGIEKKIYMREYELIFNYAQEKEKHTYRYGNVLDNIKDNKNHTEGFTRTIWRN